MIYKFPSMMSSGKRYFSLILCLCSFSFAIAQVQEGTPCETPNQAYGLCVSIYNCDILLNLLQTQSGNPQVASYLRSSTCGYIQRVPMVCCPQNRPRPVNPLTEPVTEPTYNNETDPQVRNPTGDRYEIPTPPNCGFSNGSIPRVVGGIPATLGQFPWMVALGYTNSKNPDSPKWLCGGSLITDKHILTAGHCVHNRNDLYLARVGELDLYDDEDNANPIDIKLIKAKIHEDYNPVEHTNDIAILTMEQAVDLDKYTNICLPVDEPIRSNKFVGARPFIAGWGSLYFNGPSSSRLQTVALPVLENSHCEKAFGTRAVIDDRILCAGFLNGGKDSCKGDSGGPLMTGVADEDKHRVYQIGIVSYGFKCAEQNYPGVYTRVTSFVDWIGKNLD